MWNNQLIRINPLFTLFALSSSTFHTILDATTTKWHGIHQSVASNAINPILNTTHWPDKKQIDTNTGCDNKEIKEPTCNYQKNYNITITIKVLE